MSESFRRLRQRAHQRPAGGALFSQDVSKPTDDTASVHDSERRRASTQALVVPATAIRQGAAITLFAGAIGIANDLGSGGWAALHQVPTFLDTCTFLVGLLFWPLANQPFLRKSLAISLPFIALTLVALNDAVGVSQPAVVGAWIVIVFVWVGLWFPPIAVGLLLPFAVAAYILPLLNGAPRTKSDLVAAVILMPMAVLVGSVVARRSEELREALHSQEQLLSNMAQSNLTDPLTVVGNRRLGDNLIESLSPSDAVVMLDLDHFKKVNDQYGHPAGDEVLKALGGHLRSFLRGTDAVARVGGEEFILVLRGAGGRAVDVAERVVQTWRATSPLTTISAGVAVHQSGSQPSRTYAKADEALYAAKESGRDRVRGEVS
jgi:diguanylate cyclase (GGDEF)-like protein